MWIKDDLYVPDGQSIFTHDPFLVVAKYADWYGIQMEYIVEPVDYPVKLARPFEEFRGYRIRGYEVRVSRADFDSALYSRFLDWEAQVLKPSVVLS